MGRSAIIAVLLTSPLLLGWGWHDEHRSLEWPHAGPMPDDPVKVKPYTYSPITSGNQSYRPIDPMPWGDMNRRVAPPGSLPGAPPAKGQKGGASPAKPAMPQTTAPSAPTTSQATSPVGSIPATQMPAAPAAPSTPMDHSKHGGSAPQSEAKKP